VQTKLFSDIYLNFWRYFSKKLLSVFTLIDTNIFIKILFYIISLTDSIYCIYYLYLHIHICKLAVYYIYELCLQIMLIKISKDMTKLCLESNKPLELRRVINFIANLILLSRQVLQCIITTSNFIRAYIILLYNNEWARKFTMPEVCDTFTF